MKLVTIVGARPQFIKAAAVSRAIAAHNQSHAGSPITETIIHTGQHYDHNMSRIFFEELHIPDPDYNLGVGSGSHGRMTGAMLAGIEDVLLNEKPDCVLVYGDTNSTLAAAIAAVKLHIPVAHVEAGLRSFNRYMPEETNRILTDHMSSILFCPTETAVANLKAEGIPALNRELKLPGFSHRRQMVHQVGDVMYDTVLFYKKFARRPEADLPSEFLLLTIHRPENTDNPERLSSISRACEQIAENAPILFPVHPRTVGRISNLGLFKHESIFMIEPVGYLEIMYLLNRCKMVLTDSGGLQKEAFFFQKPCITLRDETEWVELETLGVNFLTGSETVKIVSAFGRASGMAINAGKTVYGSGQASEKILNVLINTF